MTKYPQYGWIQDSIDAVRAEIESLKVFREDMKKENRLVRIVELVVAIPFKEFEGLKYNGILMSTIN